MTSIVAAFENGSIAGIELMVDSSKLEWNPHQVYNGVYLKHLVTGANTGGRFSCHLLKVEPGSALEEHVHEEKWELHKIMEGEGECILDTNKIAYQPGTLTIIPEATKHKVVAGPQGLRFLATFVPALL